MTHTSSTRVKVLVSHIKCTQVPKVQSVQVVEHSGLFYLEVLDLQEVMMSLSKWRPLSSAFMPGKTWQSEGFKSGEYVVVRVWIHIPKPFRTFRTRWWTMIQGRLPETEITQKFLTLNFLHEISSYLQWQIYQSPVVQCRRGVDRLLDQISSIFLIIRIIWFLIK